MNFKTMKSQCYKTKPLTSYCHTQFEPIRMYIAYHHESTKGYPIKHHISGKHSKKHFHLSLCNMMAYSAKFSNFKRSIAENRKETIEMPDTIDQHGKVLVCQELHLNMLCFELN